MTTIRKIAMRLANVTHYTLHRILIRFGLLRQSTSILKVRVPVAIKTSVKAKSFRGNALRQIGRAFVNQRSVPYRAFSLGVWERAGALNYKARHLHFVHKKSSGRLVLNASIQHCGDIDVLQAVKASLASPSVHTDMLKISFPRYLDAYNLGSCIAVGCGGAVYEAKFKTQPTSSQSTKFADTKNAKQQTYPYVIKILFNYDMFASTSNLWLSKEQEIVPTIDADVRGRMKLCRSLTEIHSNVAPICTAFVDIMPILPDAEALYPAFLRDLSDVGPIVPNRNVLFLVMKRYSMPLHIYLNNEYVKYTLNEISFCNENGYNRSSQNIPIYKRSVMVAQLFEAINFLFNQKVSHRDLKSDNILVELDNPDDTPHLLLSDFGCCLSLKHNKRDMRMYYLNGDDLGGNVCLRSPEIRLAKENNFVDFAKADLWASATIAIEIYTFNNPFYSRNVPFDSSNYTLDDIPVLSDTVPSPMRTLIRQILSRDPQDRPSTSLAATTSALALARTFQLSSALGCEQSKDTICIRLEPVAALIALYATETIVGARILLSSAEVTLRRLFLSRVHVKDIHEALDRFFLTD